MISSDLECPFCHGYLYKPMFTYKCIRCHHKFSSEEIEQIFMERLIKSCDEIKDNHEIKELLRKYIY